MALSAFENKFLTSLGIESEDRASGTLIRIKAGAPLNTDLLYYADDVDSGEHPLFKSDEQSAYGRLLRNKPPVGVVQWEANGVTLTKVATSSVVVKNPVIKDLDSTPRRGAFNESSVKYEGMQGTNALFTTKVDNFNVPHIDVSCSYSAGRLKISHFKMYYPPGFKIDYEKPVHARNGSSIIKAGYGFPVMASGAYNWPDLNDGSDLLVAAINQLPVPREMLLGSLPIYVDNSFESSAPYVAGTRRFYLFFPGNSDTGNGLGIYSGFMATGYIAGEGTDLVRIQGAYAEDGKKWQPFDLPVIPPNIGSISNANVGTSKSIRSRKVYPLNGPCAFVSSIEGAMSEASSDLTIEFSQKMALSVVEYELIVDKVYGSIDPASYGEYLSTGYDVLPSRKAEDVKVIIDSWVKANKGFYFVLRGEKCDGYSVKQTSLYAEYGKRRAKACKTNDFLDLKYNAEYTYKQVDNKLSGLVSRDAWMWPIEEVPVGGSRVGIPVKGTVTLTLDSNVQFSALASGSTSSYKYPMTEEGVETFFDRFEGYQIINPSVITSIVKSDGHGSTMESYTSELGGNIDAGKYQMQMVDFSAGYALTLNEYIAVGADRDKQIRFMMSQVTDFAKFDGALMRIIKSLNNEVVFNFYINRAIK